MSNAVPQFSMQQLLEAGVHFGHRTMRWNPKMAPYIYGARNKIHIIDLQQTVPLLHRALLAVRNVAAKNGRVLFVGTKTQASPVIAEAAKRCGQYYVNHRWLGGTLTNWGTISRSIKTMNSLKSQLEGEEGQSISKKERLSMEREIAKFGLSLDGIKDMGGLPDLLFIIDTNKEHIAVKEARKLGIPVVAIVDTNCDPDEVDYMVPGNDDAARSIQLYCTLVSDAVLSGLQEVLGGKIPDKDAAAKAEQKAESKKKRTGRIETEIKREEKKEDRPRKSSGKKPAKGAKSADDNVAALDVKAEDQSASADAAEPEEKPAKKVQAS